MCYEAWVRFGIRVRVRVQVRDSTIFKKVGCGCNGNRRLNKYYKYFYLWFLYIFTIKIFLKNTLLCPDSQNKERRISAVPATFKADFGLFRPYRSPVDTIRYGRYGPILAKSARFNMNRAASTQIQEKKKKKNQTWHRRTGSHIGRHVPRWAVLNSGAAPS